MKTRLWLLAALPPALALCALLPAADPPTTNITWKKTVLDKVFISEGVAVADLNKDGKLDVITGEIWYESPDWKKRRFRPGKDDCTDGMKNVYCRSFCVWTDDFNGDGWPGVLVIGFPGEPCHWYEN